MAFGDFGKLSFWAIRDDEKRKLSGRLCSAGWLGTTFSHISRFERRALEGFVKSYEGEAKLMRPEYFDSDEFLLCEQSVWVRTKELRDELWDMASKITPRDLLLPIEEFDAYAFERKNRRLCERVNWSALFGYNEAYLSIEDSTDAALIRMLIA